PDAVVVTMTGVVVANSSMKFELEQLFEVNFDNPKTKKANLTVESRVLGLLRGEKAGCAEYGDACASIAMAGGGVAPPPPAPPPPPGRAPAPAAAHAHVPAPGEVVALCVPPHQICGCDSLSVNDHDGPKKIPVQPGKYVLHQTFNIAAQSTCFLCKRP